MKEQDAHDDYDGKTAGAVGQNHTTFAQTAEYIDGTDEDSGEDTNSLEVRADLLKWKQNKQDSADHGLSVCRSIGHL